MPTAIKLQEEFEDSLQVVFVEVGRANREEMTAFAINREWFGTNAMWTKHRPFSSGQRVIPAYALLDETGAVLASGVTSRDHSKIEDLIEDHAKQRKKGPKDAPKAVAKLVASYHKGKAAEALAGLEALIAEPGRKDPEEVQAAASAWRDTLTAWIEKDVARLGWFIENGRYDQADERLDALNKSLTGHETWQGRLDEYSASLGDEALKDERDAEQALAKIEAKLFKGGTEKLKESALEKLIDQYPGTHAARRAEEWLPLAEG